MRPESDVPPTTLDGVSVKSEMPSAARTTAAVLTIAPLLPVTVTDVLAATFFDDAPKLRNRVPGGTVTDAGTASRLLLLARRTTMPFAGAGALRLTVPSTS